MLRQRVAAAIRIDQLVGGRRRVQVVGEQALDRVWNQVLQFVVRRRCASTSAQTSNRPARGAAGVSVPILHVGAPFTADLLGDGQATVTITATQLSDETVPGECTSPGNVRLATTYPLTRPRGRIQLVAGRLTHAVWQL